MTEPSDYTPTTDEVRRGYPRSYSKSIEAEYAEFDRWLAKVTGHTGEPGPTS